MDKVISKEEDQWVAYQAAKGVAMRNERAARTFAGALSSVMGIPDLQPVAAADLASSLTSATFDAVVIIFPAVSEITATSTSEALAQLVSHAAHLDSAIGKDVVLLIAPGAAAGSRLILAPTASNLRGDTDDVRLFGDAAKKGVARAKIAGSKAPLLVVLGGGQGLFKNAVQVALLAALAGLYVGLQAREAKGEATVEVVTRIGFAVPAGSNAEQIKTTVSAIEQGRRLGTELHSRDIGGGDPERMTARNAADYVKHAFSGSDVKVTYVLQDQATAKKEFPLIEAVARASFHVERHHPVVVQLEYLPEVAAHTLLFSGKGITYDTGGADVKVGGHMAGMSRDKCGAAAVAGFIKTASLLKSPVKIVAQLAFVRNSIGANSYVADEIIKAHSGARVLIGNTDAEGRLVLADCLSHLRTYALAHRVPCPHFFTVATLTGHAGRSVGPYPITLDNGPAHALDSSRKLQAVSELWGDLFEVSFIRREDVNFVKPTAPTFDVLQCNTQSSAVTSRGHQYPAAFLVIASGLDKHGKDSENPLPFSHLDIAGGALDGSNWSIDMPSGTPIVALTARYLLQDK